MQILVVSAYDVGDPNRRFVEHVVSVLEHAAPTNHVDHIDLVAAGFKAEMSQAERLAYDDPGYTNTAGVRLDGANARAPLLTDETRQSAALVQRAGALVFAYPTVMAGPPPVLKGWLDRVMVPGVAFQFNARNKVRPNLTNVRRIGLVSTIDEPTPLVRRHDDLGYRILARTLRLNCSRRCRTSRVSGRPGPEFEAEICRVFRSWS